ncbi:hypothetical protein ISG33_09135 [Glaciecola sp. MH2013]|uniref:glycine-rich domain-containing protein n=1 Tax=Glaciecola sp. MH2013 TaxID=2785524 RepID=UPI00189F55BF|nr:hypothetical protein [Glaciecola sp. MH2013]MBF7073555.1 hypothetical protein [Glaciecola sp. MH2013]
MDQSLYKAIMALNISDKNAAFTFEMRLARENAWSLDYAKQVVHEYKRFIYLIASTNRSQTPSDQVDQAWHLHMTYTDSYWNVMCKEIIGKNIHHGPTRGGAEQRQTYREQYINTLHTYRDVFGDEPASIWPSADKRFANASEFVRLNKADYWLLPKLGFPKFLVAPLSVAGFLSLAFVSYAAGDSHVEFSRLLTIGGLVVFIVLMIWLVVRLSSSSKKDSGADGTGGYIGSGSSSNANKHDAANKKNDIDVDIDSGGSGCGSGCGGCGS